MMIMTLIRTKVMWFLSADVLMKVNEINLFNPTWLVSCLLEVWNLLLLFYPGEDGSSSTWRKTQRSDHLSQTKNIQLGDRQINNNEKRKKVILVREVFLPSLILHLIQFSKLKGSNNLFLTHPVLTRTRYIRFLLFI